MAQCAAYADDVELFTRTERDLEETFVVSDRETKKVGLEINKEKTKYLLEQVLK